MQLFHSRLDQFYEHLSARLVLESVLGQDNPIPVTGIGHRKNTEIREPHNNAPSFSRQVTTHSSVPRVDFPRFDATNAHSWLLSCEAYFRVVQRPYRLGFKLFQWKIHISTGPCLLKEFVTGLVILEKKQWWGISQTCNKLDLYKSM